MCSIHLHLLLHYSHRTSAVFSVPHNKLWQSQWLKATCSHHHTLSMAHGSRQSWAWCSARSLTKLQSRSQRGCLVIWKVYFQAHSHYWQSLMGVLLRNLDFTCYWLEAVAVPNGCLQCLDKRAFQHGNLLHQPTNWISLLLQSVKTALLHIR